jgi:hypothetical protein
MIWELEQVTESVQKYEVVADTIEDAVMSIRENRAGLGIEPESYCKSYIRLPNKHLPEWVVEVQPSQTSS